MDANDVRKLMPKPEKPVNDIVDEITLKCAEEAKKGKSSLRTSLYDFGANVDLTDKQKEIINKLKELGFHAEQKVEFKQFVVVYLFVSWKEDN